jgi:hypothetical protein
MEIFSVYSIFTVNVGTYKNLKYISQHVKNIQKEEFSSIEPIKILRKKNEIANN